ncbi:hypothetical protein [Gracilimonas sp.]|uniref:VPS10 domain-containing protein n=1 Tax=Gracilimonas sp. TaxID=1974203 RepID=UPI0028725F9D|nr:hypothetical protein [Gracilimonas sp.]
MNRITRGWQIFLLASLTILLGINTEGYAQAQLDAMLDDVNYRDIGPTRQGGRYVDYAVPKQDHTIIYAATGSGGLWKSVDNGFTWNPIFDHESVISIGDVAVAPTNPDIVWVGTGEANNSRSTYYGDGVYKSTDAGKTWTNMGLPESHHIGRILVHPENPDIVWVAALGHLYSENPERGVYKSTDGGESWNKVLDVVVAGKNIGAVDIAINPDNPDILLAATYDKVRRPWTFNEGGPGSGIYKSTDGGENWRKLSKGLPGGMLGRIGIDFAPSNPNIIYANIENVNVKGMSYDERHQALLEGRPVEGDNIGDQVYRSDDMGESWYLTHDPEENVGGGPAYYYQQMGVDPQDPDHVYVLGIRMWETTDGGKTWDRPFFFGGDNHAIWIDPDNPKHMILGYDHGMGITYDGGDNWYHPDEKPLAQFYAIGFDMDYPYNVYGGTQDNGSLMGPNTKRSGNPIHLEDWKRVGGGDGMYQEVDPSNSRYLYNESQFGPLVRRDLKTGETSSIAYRNIDRNTRWNWMSPILISPHNSDVIYHGGNVLVRSNYRGETWEVVSPDLSNADSAKIVGTGNIQYATITTIDESPLSEGELWAGTDDGNVQLSRDGGDNWTKLNDIIPGNPEYWVSRVIASQHHEGTAYVTYTGLRRDDFRPFVYKTTDWGESWTAITNGLPDNEAVNVIREDHTNPNLLFVGTDMHVYASLDGGNSWNRMKGDMPTQPVHDLKIHPRENDLIVGTHGRGMFITDISWLQEMSHDMMNSDFHLFPIEPTYRWVDNGDNAGSFINFNGEPASEDVVINYYLREEQNDPVTIGVYKAGRLIYEFEGKGEAGLNTVEWEQEFWERERTEEEKEQMRERAERLREFGWSDEQVQQYLSPSNLNYVTGNVDTGIFTITVTSNGQSASKTADIREDHWYDDWNRY